MSCGWKRTLTEFSGFEPYALREGARFTVPERSTLGASDSKTPVSADSIRKSNRTVVGKLMDRQFLTRVTLAKKQRGYSIFLDDDRNGALKQEYGNDQMVLILDS